MDKKSSSSAPLLELTSLNSTNPPPKEQESYAPASEIKHVISRLQNGELFLKSLEGHNKDIFCIAVSNDGRIITGSMDKTIKIWNSKGCEFTLTGHSDTVKCLGLLPNGKLATGSWDRSIKIWDLENKTEVAMLTGHIDQISSLVVISDDRIITGSRDKSIRIWSLDTNSEELILGYHTDFVNCLALSSDGLHLASGSQDKLIKIWNLSQNAEEFVLSGHTGFVNCIAYTVDKKFVVSGSSDRTIKVWNFSERREEFTLRGHPEYVRCLTITRDSQFIVSGGGDKMIKVWSITKMCEEFTYEGHTGFLNCLALDEGDKIILSGSADKSVKSWLLQERKQETTLLGHTDAVTCTILIKTASGELLVSGSGDNSIKIWDALTGCEQFSLIGHIKTIWCLAATKDGRYLVSGSEDKNIKIWDLEERVEISTLSGHGSTVRCIAISPDEKFIISGSWDRTVKFWNFSDKTLAFTLEGHKNSVFGLVITPDGRNVVSCSADTTIKIWNISSRTEEFNLTGHPDYIYTISISQDGRYIATGSMDKTVKIWDLYQQKEAFTLYGHTGAVRNVAFTQDGRYVISTSADKTVRIWNILERREEMSISGHSNVVHALAISDDGSKIFTGAADNSIKVWTLTDHIDPLEPYGYQSRYEYLSMISALRNDKQFTIEHSRLIISSYRFNLLHILAYLAKLDALENLLKLDVPLRTDKIGRSPISYSIQRNSQHTTDLLLNYLVDTRAVNSPYFLSYAHCIRDDLSKIISTSSTILPDFLDALYISYNKISVPKVPVPATQYSSICKIYENEYIETSNEELKQEFNLEFNVSAVALPTVMGSANSIAFLRTLASCENQAIYRTYIINSFVKSKWSAVKAYVYALTITIWLNLAIMILLVVKDDEIISKTSRLSILVSFIVLNILLFLYEVIQMVSGFVEYIKEPWNILDISRFSLYVIWVVLEFQETPIMYISWLMVLTTFLRGITGFRAFGNTRFYVRLIIKAFQDILSFICIFCYSNFAFGTLYMVSSQNPISFSGLWGVSFNLSLGDFSGIDFDQGFSVQYLCFLFASVINIVMMLNLLISILGDSYERFQIEAAEIDIREMAEQLIEIEEVMIWNRKKNENYYFQQVENERSNYQNNWEGKVKAITNSMVSSEDRIMNRIEALDKKIEKLLQGSLA